MEGRVLRHQCACGWARSWHDSPAYLDRVIDHPWHGRISGRNLVRADIASHRCEDYRKWQETGQPAMMARRAEREASEKEAARARQADSDAALDALRTRLSAGA